MRSEAIVDAARTPTGRRGLHSLLAAGWPESVSGTTIDRQFGDPLDVGGPRSQERAEGFEPLARLTATLVHELVRSGSRRGLQTMCEGGGMANATIIESLA